MPPGSAKRRFMSMTRDAMCGLLPSQTMRPFSSWLNPSWMNARRNVPDCELPSEIAPANSAGHRIRRAGVVLLLVAEKRIDVARGGEPDAQHQRILRGVLQFVEQRRIEAVLHADRGAGSGVPGNGVVAQSANAQSLAGITTVPLLTPVALSDTADTSDALVVSSVAGGYGDG